MTPSEFKAARLSLGLSVHEMAQAVGITAQAVRRLEGPGAHRAVTPTMERLLRAFLTGYRPENWPIPGNGRVIPRV
jgi:transcriptional regulator with XRE-family HTH domain